MKLRIRNALNFIKYSEFEIDLPNDCNFNDVITILREKLKPKSKNIKYLIIRKNEQIEINSNDYFKKLNDLNLKEEDSIQVEEKIDFLKIPFWFLVFCSYIGPPIIFTYKLIYDESEYLNNKKRITTLLVYFHYFRRIYENYFIMNIGKSSTSIFSIDFIGCCLHYWILFGIFISYQIFDKNYNDYHYPYSLIYILLFFYAEHKNYKSHVYLTKLKDANNGQRAIPREGLFEYVTCAHYFWELMSWLFFSLYTNVITAYLFVLFSFISMTVLALNKHKSMMNYFGSNYPSHKKAIIPFII